MICQYLFWNIQTKNSIHNLSKRRKIPSWLRPKQTFSFRTLTGKRLKIWPTEQNTYEGFISCVVGWSMIWNNGWFKIFTWIYSMKFIWNAAFLQRRITVTIWQKHTKEQSSSNSSDIISSMIEPYFILFFFVYGFVSSFAWIDKLGIGKKI